MQATTDPAFNANAFRHARQTSTLSQTMLARIAGCSPSTIRRLERIGGTLPADLFARFCRILGVTAETLLTI